MARVKREIQPIHPGEILLEEFLKPLPMSRHELALALRVPANRIGKIVEGGTSAPTRPCGWGTISARARRINLQARYDLESARQEFSDRIEREVLPRSAA